MSGGSQVLVEMESASSSDVGGCPVPMSDDRHPGKKVMRAKKVMKAVKKATASEVEVENAMKVMKKKSTSKVARGPRAKAVVLRDATGRKRTAGGLTAEHLMKNKKKRVVSIKRSYNGADSPWITAVKKARAALGIEGFEAVKKGRPLYAKAKEFFKAVCAI